MFLCILRIWNILKKIIQNPTKILIKDGGFVAHRSSSQKFKAVALNRLSVNREGKSQGGIISLTLRKSAMTQQPLTRHVTAEYENAFKPLTTDHNDKGTKHKELGKGRTP